MDLSQWEKVHRPRGQRGKAKRRHPPPFAHMDADTEALQSWRRHEEPKETVRIPEALAMHEERFHEQLAREYGAFIFSVEKRAAAGSIEFGIWGETDAAVATKKAILEVIAELEQPKATKSKRALNFPTLHSMTPTVLKRAEKAWKREVARNKYRRYPHPSQAFGAIGTFHWPVNEWRPDEILGANFEALDPIRMDCSCYVVFVPEKAAFQVMGKADDVKTGLSRLRKTCFQIAAHQIAPIRLYLLHWALDDEVPSHVVLKPYNRTATMSGPPSKETITPSTPMGMGTAFDESRLLSQTSQSERQMYAQLLKVLPNLHYYRASIQMRIRWGTFLATSFKKAKDNTYTLSQYEEMTGESQFAGEVTLELGEPEVERNALATLQQADELLVPQDVLTHDLSAVKAVYSVAIVFADAGGDLQLAMTWVESQDEGSDTVAFEVVSKKWTRPERQSPSAVPILDVSLKSLSTGSAWHVSVESRQPVEDAHLSQSLCDFSDGIRLDLDAVRQWVTDRPFVKHKAFPSQLKRMHQRMSYRFGVKASDYTVELSRFQDFEFQERPPTLLRAARGPTVYEPRWSLEVYRAEWDQMFTLNERLPIGERADWDASADVWFPEDMTDESTTEGESRGFAQLMEKLNALSKVLTGAKDEDLIGGMTGMNVD